MNGKGDVLLVWTEGTSWNKGGSLAYQLYDPTGKPSGESMITTGIPKWSFAAAVPMPGGGFSILY